MTNVSVNTIMTDIEKRCPNGHLFYCLVRATIKNTGS